MKQEKMKHGMAALRETPVRDLTPEQCQRLLSHHHGGSLSPERRKAYLLKSSGANWTAYFNATEASAVQAWIEHEGKPATAEQEPAAAPVVFKITVTEEANGCRAEISREKPDRKLLAIVGDHATQQAAFVALLQHCIETGEGV